MSIARPWKAWLVVAALAALGWVGCKKHVVAARWQALGFPLDKDHAEIDPEETNTDATMQVKYPGRTTCEPIFERYEDALIKAGYAIGKVTKAPDQTWWEVSSTKDGKTLTLHASQNRDGVDLMINERPHS